MSFSEWKKYRVGDIAKVKNGFAFKGKDFISSGVPVIKIKNVKPGKILLNDLSYVSREVADNASKYKINVGDILITMSGNRIDGSPDSWVGKVAMFREEGEYLLNQRVGIIEINSKKIDSIFLSYLLSSIQTQQHFITKANSSGGQANISPDIIHDTEFFAPDLPEQKQIASILRSIDDTIENNQQINKTLEEMAKAIFKEWFVDFNFPNATGKFQETEIGKIPVGWKSMKLNEALEIKYGKDHKHLQDGEFPVYGSGGIMRYAEKPLYESESILIPRKGTLSNLFYINKPFWTVDTMFYSKIKIKNSGKYLFHLLQTLNLASMNVGSAVPSLTTEVLNNIQIAMPDENTLKEFEKIVSSLFNQAEQNIAENQSLINLRDTLLPKLMKREIEIREKETV